jgi:hypothetical protein
MIQAEGRHRDHADIERVFAETAPQPETITIYAVNPG